jgi:hypothetical protein
MKPYKVIIILLFTIGCVDRIDFNIGSASDYAIVINGFISDQPGPYQINVSKAFDIESKLTTKTPISVKKMTLVDNIGNLEQLTSTEIGVYQTNPNGIRGMIGGIYSLEVELLDGRIYQSIPDTLRSSGTVDSVYFNQTTYQDKTNSTRPGFEVYFDSTLGGNEDFNYLWQFVGTYQIDTNPELYDTLCVEARCPKPKRCSGYIVTSSGELVQERNCECCTCWVNFFNENLIISDGQLIESDRFSRVKATTIPINEWTFMYKVHAEIRQMSLSRQAFAFWKAIKSQDEALGSLFQPITGRVPSNFIQTSGKKGAVAGLFYATAIHSKAIFITTSDVHPLSLIPSVSVPFINDCRKAFPNSKIERPSYWN